MKVKFHGMISLKDLVYLIYLFKDAPIYLLDLIKNNTNTITGSYIREILNVTNKTNIFEVGKSDLKKLKFYEIPDEERWRIGILKELTNIRMNKV